MRHAVLHFVQYGMPYGNARQNEHVNSVAHAVRHAALHFLFLAHIRPIISDLVLDGPHVVVGENG